MPVHRTLNVPSLLLADHSLSLFLLDCSLKGHFSRLEHQATSFYGRSSPHVLPSLTLHLPAGIHSAYYYDLIGNVSTSHLRQSHSQGIGGHNQFSVLELRPRYPLLGGWNYTFTLGWDSPLADYAGFDKDSGKYIVGIPLMTMIPGAVVDEAEIKIILPEGATLVLWYMYRSTHYTHLRIHSDVDYLTPFSPIQSGISTHITYLDTVGRPAVVMEYGRLTHKHAGIIYVSAFSGKALDNLADATS